MYTAPMVVQAKQEAQNGMVSVTLRGEAPAQPPMPYPSSLSVLMDAETAREFEPFTAVTLTVAIAP